MDHKDTIEITAPQIRAARGLLGWSQDELAKRSGTSPATVKRLESGRAPTVRVDSLLKIRSTFEEAGLRFISNEFGGLYAVPPGGIGVRFDRPVEALEDLDKYRQIAQLLERISTIIREDDAKEVKDPNTQKVLDDLHGQVRQLWDELPRSPKTTRMPSNPESL